MSIINEIANGVNFDKDLKTQTRIQQAESVHKNEMLRKNMSFKEIQDQMLLAWRETEISSCYEPFYTLDELLNELNFCQQKLDEIIPQGVNKTIRKDISLSEYNYRIFNDFKAQAYLDRIDVLLWYGDIVFEKEAKYIQYKQQNNFNYV